MVRCVSEIGTAAVVAAVVAAVWYHVAVWYYVAAAAAAVASTPEQNWKAVRESHFFFVCFAVLTAQLGDGCSAVVVGYFLLWLRAPQGKERPVG